MAFISFGFHFRHSFLAAGCLLAASLASAAQSRIYTPTAPEGANSATFAATKDDWFLTIQQKFDRYSGKPADILFDGDSITNRWETTGNATWIEKFANRAADFGIEGDRTENLLWRLSKGQVTGVNPKLVVLMIGTNNLSRNSAEQITGGVQTIIQQYEVLCPSAHILLMAIFPRGRTAADPSRVKVARINQQLAAQFGSNADMRVTFIDIGKQLIEKDGTISEAMMPDMVHPTAEGYKIWADAIAPYVEKYAAPPPASR